MADSRTALITNIKLLNEQKLDNKVIGTNLNRREALINPPGLKKGSYLGNFTPMVYSTVTGPINMPRPGLTTDYSSKKSVLT